MEVAVEKKSNLERQVKVTIPAKEIDDKTNAKLTDISKTAKISGFRPGKVPMDVIKKRYGDTARQDVIADAIQTSYFEALTKEKLHPAGQPHIEPKASKFGEPLEYTATFEIYPEFKVKDLTGQKLEKLTAKITDADIDNMIEKLRKQRAEWKEVERAAKNGDQLVIDFEGKIKGELFDGGAGKDFKLELGAGSMLEDFEKPLVGAKAGDELVAKVKFPKDYHGQDVAGQKADFAIKVKSVSESQLPELNKKFYEELGIKKGGMTELKKKIKDNLEKQLETAVVRKLKDKVSDKLLDINEVELPNALVDEEVNRLQQQAKQQFMQYTGQKNIDDIPDLPRQHFEEEAKKRVALGLILGEIIKEAKIEVDKDKVKAKVESMAAGYKDSAEVVKWYYNNKQYLAQIESVVLEEQVFDVLEKQADLVEKTVTYEEVINA